MKITISQDLRLDTDAGTQTFAFIGRKGSGKSYGSGKLVEELIACKIQAVVLDTVGNWYGLRLADNGTGPGIDIPIFGGLRGDIPLEPTGGALVADVVTESGRSLVIDISQFSKADRQRFATAFGERLWKNKKSERNPSPVHLVIEESQLIIPENVRGDTAAMVGIYEEIIRLGRNYGIGVTMITQRPQSVNKEVLNQTECLMVFQVNGAHERKALRDWIVHQGMDTSLLNELPSLKPGTCYVWSPQWLGILKKITIAKKWTLDSTSTPKAGGTSRGRELKPIDLQSIQEKMQATIDKAMADDPRELKKKIFELEKQLKSQPVKSEKKEVMVITDSQLKRMDDFLTKLVSEAERHGKAMTMLWENHDEVAKSLLAALRSVYKQEEMSSAKQFAEKRLTQHNKVMTPAPSGPRVISDSSFGRCELAILKFLAMREGKSFSKSQIGGMTNYSPNSGGFNNAISKLSTAGLIIKQGSAIMMSSAALKEVKAALGGEYSSPETYSLEQWLNKLGKCPRELYSVLLQNPHEEYPKDRLGDITGYSSSSGGFNNAISELCTLGLAERVNSKIRLNQELLNL